MESSALAHQHTLKLPSAPHPIGSLWVWATEPRSADDRGRALSAGIARLLLDGQQRMITILYGVIRGKPSALSDAASSGKERPYVAGLRAPSGPY